MDELHTRPYPEVVVVGGVDSDVGALCALDLLRRGSSVIGVGAHSSSAAKQFPTYDAVEGELSDPATWSRVGPKLGILSGSIGLVTAPLLPAARSGEPQSWLTQMEAVIRSTVLAFEAVTPVMRTRGSGVIVSTVEVPGRMLPDQSAAHAAATVAIAQLVSSITVSGAAEGLRANTVQAALSEVQIAQTAEELGGPSRFPARPGAKGRHAAVPTQEIVSLVLFLLTPGSAALSGAELQVRGAIAGAGAATERTPRSE